MPWVGVLWRNKGLGRRQRGGVRGGGGQRSLSVSVVLLFGDRHGGSEGGVRHLGLLPVGPRAVSRGGQVFTFCT